MALPGFWQTYMSRIELYVSRVLVKELNCVHFHAKKTPRPCLVYRASVFASYCCSVQSAGKCELLMNPKYRGSSLHFPFEISTRNRYQRARLGNTVHALSATSRALDNRGSSRSSATACSMTLAISVPLAPIWIDHVNGP